MNRLDILNRGEFVEQLIKLVENISDNKSSASFAINGAWGCGKSFVLDMFQEKLEKIQSEETSNDKYFVIRYDSWKFDYYEEPLVAIVASMISIIEEKTKLFPNSEKKSELLGMLKAVGITLLSIGNSALRNKTGIDFKEIYETVCNSEKEAAVEYENQHSYDAYFSLNKVIEKLVNLLQELANEYTIVFLVDELDRCLPEYTVKVLERLHHLTEGKDNIITIISIDKQQLMASVKNTFGFENPEKYLEKFISFELKLNNGEVSETICDKYADYIALFDKDIIKFDDPLEECIQAIFKGIDIRTQEQLIKRAMLAHKLLYSDKKDYSFLCMELILTIMICVCKDNSCFTDIPIDIRKFDDILVSTGNKPKFVDFFKTKFNSITSIQYEYSENDKICLELQNKDDLYGAILFSWCGLHKINKFDVIQYAKKEACEPISKNHEELKKIAETIKMMS